MSNKPQIQSGKTYKKKIREKWRRQTASLPDSARLTLTSSNSNSVLTLKLGKPGVVGESCEAILVKQTLPASPIVSPQLEPILLVYSIHTATEPLC